MRTTPSCLRLLGLVTALVLAGSAAHAVDGVVEINQERALAGGVTPGDSPGFPVTIQTPSTGGGSYRLTGSLDLSLEGENQHGILVVDSRVTIDLNGFEIRGPCSNLTCSSSALGAGVQLSRGDSTVVNGSIQQMAYGIQSGSAVFGTRVERVTVRNVRRDGIFVGGNGLVKDCVVHNAAEVGIRFNLGAVIKNNVSSANFGHGFSTFLPENLGILEANMSRLNGGDGFNLGEGSVVKGNLAADNTGAGFRVKGGGVLDGNVAIRNGFVGFNIEGHGVVVTGNTAAENASNGFNSSQAAWIGLLFADNVARGNGGTGIRTGAASLVRNNVSTGNTATGITVGTDVTLLGNSIFGNQDGVSAPAGSGLSKNTVSGSSGTDVSAGPAIMDCNLIGGVPTNCPN